MGTPEFFRRTADRREFLELAGGVVATAALSPLLIRWLSSETKAAEKPSVISKPLVVAPTVAVKEEKSQKMEVGENVGGVVKNGIEFLEQSGLKGKIIYLVYGRPAGGWGSLGKGRTAEECWTLAKQMQAEVALKIQRPASDFAYTIVNAVYFSDNIGSGSLKGVFIEKALELAPLQNGLVALDFSNLGLAKEVVSVYEKTLPPEKMVCLAISLDVEHFPESTLAAEKINEFTAWFAGKHKMWAQAAKKDIPGFVFVYTFGGGRISNLDKLNQYDLENKTLVIPIFDGFGTDKEKLTSMAGYVRALKNTDDNPALIGVMEFYQRWKYRYDKVPTEKTFGTLSGAPIFVFASQ